MRRAGKSFTETEFRGDAKQRLDGMIYFRVHERSFTEKVIVAKLEAFVYRTRCLIIKQTDCTSWEAMVSTVRVSAHNNSFELLIKDFKVQKKTATESFFIRFKDSKAVFQRISTDQGSHAFIPKTTTRAEWADYGLLRQK